MTVIIVYYTYSSKTWLRLCTVQGVVVPNNLEKKMSLLAGLPLRLYIGQIYRSQIGLSRCAPGLRYAHIVRDSWTRLNVLPAKIMQVLYAIFCYNFSFLMA